MSFFVKRRKTVSVVAVILAATVLIVAYFGTVGIKKLLSSAKKLSGKFFDVSQDFVRFLDVGQGDCILIYSNGRSLLLDTATSNYKNEIAADLNSCGIDTVDAVMISHLHTDHTGSLPDICDNYKIENLILPELSISSEGMPAAQYAVNAVTEAGGGVYNAEQGLNFNVGEFEVTVLASYGDFDEVNNQSLFVIAEIDGVKFMFSGDAESQAEKRILKEGLNLDCDVFKAGHHGSNTSNTRNFLEAMTPKYVAISCGEDNMYGHPHDEVTRLYDEMDITAYRTDKSGDITFYVSDGKISVETEK